MKYFFILLLLQTSSLWAKEVCNSNGADAGVTCVSIDCENPDNIENDPGCWEEKQLKEAKEKADIEAKKKAEEDAQACLVFDSSKESCKQICSADPNAQICPNTDATTPTTTNVVPEPCAEASKAGSAECVEVCK